MKEMTINKAFKIIDKYRHQNFTLSCNRENIYRAYIDLHFHQHSDFPSRPKSLMTEAQTRDECLTDMATKLQEIFANF